MKKLRAALLLPLLSVLLATASAGQVRGVVYGGKNPPSPALMKIAETLADPRAERVALETLPPAGVYFVRLSERRFILDGDGTVAGSAALHARPVVFITTPEGLYGRSLLEIFAEIGYEAESILSSYLGKEMVAVVFRYPDAVAKSEVKDGRLPAEWENTVFVPTWENVFALFHRLALKDAEAGPSGPRTLSLSEGELGFILKFPEEGKRRVSQARYGGLKAAGGPDWTYRQLLETRLSVFEHFRGNGRTQNELIDPDNKQPERGLREYVGPNWRLAELPEVAVVGLGWVYAGPGDGAPPPGGLPARPSAPACAGASPCCCPQTR